MCITFREKMLEVTILKVTHSGASEAKKVLDYIKNCDIYAPEVAVLTEQKAQLKGQPRDVKTREKPDWSNP